MDSSLNWKAIVHHNNESSLVVEVKFKQHLDLALMKFKVSVLIKLNESFSLGCGVLMYKGILYIPNVERLRDRILEEAHGPRYSIHMVLIKMYHDLRDIYWWKGLKRNIAEFIVNCPNFQQLKAEHQKSGDLLQEIQIPSGGGKTSICTL